MYGEWRVPVRPDRGPAYQRLIEQSGLSLFRATGGRMVGWWETLIGDLYEQVTIWGYDAMAAFERTVGHLARDEAFARFVEARDPLLAGEESRFPWLAPGAERPRLAESAPFVVHEIHRVPLAREAAFLEFMTRHGLDLLNAPVLIGDRPHEPGHIEEGLRPVFEATGVVPHLTVNVRSLSTESLAKVRLLVILRDGPSPPTRRVGQPPGAGQGLDGAGDLVVRPQCHGRIRPRREMPRAPGPPRIPCIRPQESMGPVSRTGPR